MIYLGGPNLDAPLAAFTFAGADDLEFWSLTQFAVRNNQVLLCL